MTADDGLRHLALSRGLLDVYTLHERVCVCARESAYVCERVDREYMRSYVCACVCGYSSDALAWF